MHNCTVQNSAVLNGLSVSGTITKNTVLAMGMKNKNLFC